MHTHTYVHTSLQITDGSENIPETQLPHHLDLTKGMLTKICIQLHLQASQFFPTIRSQPPVPHEGTNQLHSDLALLEELVRITN